MPECPRCHQPVDSTAIACPFCRAALKAYGHPGITLHRATGEDYLCKTCIYHEDDTCNFPQRPYARECTLYSDRPPAIQPDLKDDRAYRRRLWLNRNAPWLILSAVLGISLLVAFSNR